MMAYALEDEFGDIIKKARRGLDLGLDQLSDATQIPNPDLSKMEDYLLKPTVDQVSTLANQLDLDADKLLRIAEENWTPTYIHQHEPKPKSATPLQLVEHGDEIQVGALQVLVLDTPGHTPGGCAFYTRNTVIVGDAIFAGSVGNASVSYEGLLSSVRQNVLTLPDQTYLFPGHGPATTVAEEKAHNPFF